MTGTPDTLIVVPARYGSSRFPGKPLAEIAGRSMISRVVQVANEAAKSAKAAVIVATDDDRIKAHVERIGTPCVMTDPSLASGSDRALAAADLFAPQADFIVNLQGDAPFTPPSHIEAVLRSPARQTADVVTIANQLSWSALDRLRVQKQTTPFSGTTCSRDASGRALWFSKTILPAIRQEPTLREEGAASPVLQHVGLYGYRREALEAFCALSPGHYETLEGLEQLRFLENGMRIHIELSASSEFPSFGIDTLEDLARAEDLIARHGDPHRTIM